MLRYADHGVTRWRSPRSHTRGLYRMSSTSPVSAEPQQRSFEIDLAGCRARQRRLIEQMLAQDVELAIVTRPEQVQWLTGVRSSLLAEPAAALWSDGQCLLVCPAPPPQRAAAD